MRESVGCLRESVQVALRWGCAAGRQAAGGGRWPRAGRRRGRVAGAALGWVAAVAVGMLAVAPAGRSAQINQSFQLTVTISPEVQISLSAASVQVSNAGSGQQSGLTVLLKANAPWSLTLTPDAAAVAGLPSGSVDWRVDQGAWQGLSSGLSVSGTDPTGDAGRQIAVDFAYRPSFGHRAGTYTIPFAVTASATL